MGGLQRLHPADFVRGLLYPLRGFAILRRHPGLSRYWVPPILLTFAALVFSVVFAVRYHDDALELLWATPVGETLWAWLLRAAHFILRLLGLGLGIGLGMLVCVAVANLIAAPFNDALSESVEEIETGHPSPAFSLLRMVRELGRTLRLELTKLLLYAAVMGPALVFSWLVPGVGQVFYVLFGALFTALYLAVDYIDWPASRRGFDFGQRFAVLRARPLMTLGFGCGVAGCLFVPLLNLFFMPLAVAGGTRLFLDLLAYREREG